MDLLGDTQDEGHDLQEGEDNIQDEKEIKDCTESSKR